MGLIERFVAHRQSSDDYSFAAWLNNQLTFSPGRKWGFLGDSITAGSGASNVVYGFVTQTRLLVGGAYIRPTSVNAGTAGQNSTQIAARLQSDVIDAGCQALIVLAGTNDVGQNVALNTYTANMTAIMDAAYSAGLRCIVCTVPPRAVGGNDSTMIALTASYNAWLVANAAAHHAVIADTYTALEDPGTGNLLAAYINTAGSNYVHPNNLGHYRMGQTVASVVSTLTGTTLSLVDGDSRASNLLLNPLMAGAGPLPTSWTEYTGGTGSTPTYSTLADVSGFLRHGQWVQMDQNNVSGVSATRRLTQAVGSGWSVGDVLVLTCRGQVEVISGDWEGAAVGNVSGSVANTIINQGASGISSGPVWVGPNIGPGWQTWTVPAGTTSMRVWLGVKVPDGVHIKARFGEVGIYNLTRLGLTAQA